MLFIEVSETRRAQGQRFQGLITTWMHHQQMLSVSTKNLREDMLWDNTGPDRSTYCVANPTVVANSTMDSGANFPCATGIIAGAVTPCCATMVSDNADALQSSLFTDQHINTELVDVC